MYQDSHVEIKDLFHVDQNCLNTYAIVYLIEVSILFSNIYIKHMSCRGHHDQQVYEFDQDHYYIVLQLNQIDHLMDENVYKKSERK
jgi:hypothetical protein